MDCMMEMAYVELPDSVSTPEAGDNWLETTLLRLKIARQRLHQANCRLQAVRRILQSVDSQAHQEAQCDIQDAEPQPCAAVLPQPQPSAPRQGGSRGHLRLLTFD